MPDEATQIYVIDVEITISERYYVRASSEEEACETAEAEAESDYPNTSAVSVTDCDVSTDIESYISVIDA